MSRSSTCGCRPTTPTRDCAPRSRSAATIRTRASWCSPSTSRPGTPDLLRMFSGGVGYLLKDRVANVGEFIDAITRVAAGGTAFDPEVVSGMLNATRHANVLAALTGRERDVLALMAEGRSNSAIADQLVVSERAVEKHI